MSAPALDGRDPLPVLNGLATLRRLIGAYPSGHPMIVRKLRELGDLVDAHLRVATPLRIDVAQGDAFIDGVAAGTISASHHPLVQELVDLGIDSVCISEGVEPRELQAVAEFLWTGGNGDSAAAQLAARGVHHITLGTLLPLDTRWRAAQWPDAPTGPLDPAYAEALLRTRDTFETTAAGQRLDVRHISDLVQLLIHQVAKSEAALAQILAVKQYENLTYCHSVNVAMLSLLLGREIGLDERTLRALVEAAVLHDIGKTRVPLEIVRKPGPLDARERAVIDTHTTLGAEILVQVDGLHPLTPTVALEHHRGIKGTGYPALGDALPHPMSQIVSVADVYEALTGARTYQEPFPPERACLILSRLAGETLNTALVKTFVNAVTFFPLGSVVRTNRDELGVVVRTQTGEPLHPVLALLDPDGHQPLQLIDTAVRDTAGGYERHVTATLPAPEDLDMRKIMAFAHQS